MKKIKHLGALLLTAFAVALLLPSQVKAQESIQSFDVEINVLPSGEFEVKEIINYDFGRQDKHGIFRFVPKIYEDRGDKYRSRLENFSVVNSAGVSYQFKDESDRENYSFRIGDPKVTISGEKTYILNYKIRGAIIPFEEFDEIYWNATGNDWEVPINKASLSINLPKAVSEDQLEVYCYEGYRKSREQCEDVSIETVGASTTVKFSSVDLRAGQGLTGAIGFPKGIVREPFQEPVGLSAFLVQLIGLAVGMSLLGFIFWAVEHWKKHGRSPRGKGVVRQFEPPKGMSPSEVGYIVDEKIDNRDISAELVYLAERGFMHILAIPKTSLFSKGSDYYFLKVKDADDSLSSHGRLLFDNLFAGRWSMNSMEKENLKKDILRNKRIKVNKEELLEKIDKAETVTALDELSSPNVSTTFHSVLQEVKGELAVNMVRKDLFIDNPQEVKLKYSIIAVLGGVGAVLLPVIALANDENLLAIFGGVAGAVVFVVGLILSRVMVKMTDRGVVAKEDSLGLKEYLSIAEKDRLEFHFNPKNNPELFEKLLPFAIALGVEKKWAKELDNINIEPGWYSDASRQGFTIGVLSESLSSFNTATMASYKASSAASSAASAGGGFSGGGAGGGGGGSW